MLGFVSNLEFQIVSIVLRDSCRGLEHELTRVLDPAHSASLTLEDLIRLHRGFQRKLLSECRLEGDDRDALTNAVDCIIKFRSICQCYFL